MENNRRASDGALPRELISTPMSIAQIWSILWARKRMIIFITGVVALATIFVVLKVIPQVYSSTATLFVSQRIDDPVSGGESSNSFGNAAAQIDYHLATQIEFMRTPSVLIPVVEQFNLIENERYMAGYVGDGSEDTKKRWAMESLRKRISIGQRSGSLLIKVTVTERDAQASADIANAIAAEFKVPQRDVLLLVRRVMNNKRAQATTALRLAAEEQPEAVDAELELEQ